MLRKKTRSLSIVDRPAPSIDLSLEDCRKIGAFFTVLIKLDRQKNQPSLVRASELGKLRPTRKKQKSKTKYAHIGPINLGPYCLHIFLGKITDYCLWLANFVMYWLL